jgi:hypothetical protein
MAVIGPMSRRKPPENDEPVSPEVIENDLLRRENEALRHRVAAIESAARSAITLLKPYGEQPAKRNSGRGTWTAWTHLRK